MKLIYCTSISYPSNYANRLQTLQTAEAFAKVLGDDFVLSVNYVKQNDLYTNKLVNFHSQKSFILAWKQISYINKNKVDTVYCREYPLLFFIMLYNSLFFHNKLRFFYEGHSAEKGFRFWYVIKHAKHIFCTTNNLKNYLLNKVLYLPSTVVPNGVNVNEFNIQDFDISEAKKQFNIPLGSSVVSYIGSVGVYDWKGVDIFIESYKFLQEKNIVYLVVGVKDGDLETFQKKYQNDNIIFMPRVSHVNVIRIINLSDILVLPNKSNDLVSELYTSPIKMFEYMASGKPIVASDLPSIREVLSEKNAVLVKSGDPRELAVGIEKVVSNPVLGDKISTQAFTDVQKYSWDERVKKILEVINFSK